MYTVILLQAALFIPVSQFVLLVVVFILSVYEEPYKLGRGLLILVIGIPFYLVGVRWQSKPSVYTQFMSKYY